MLRNNISLALRHLWKNRFHTAIHLLGLSIGASACLVIYLIVNYELSFNKEIPDSDRIYRIYSTFSGTFSGLNRGVPWPTGARIQDDFTGVENVARFQGFGMKAKIPVQNKEFDYSRTIIIANADYFEVFSSYQWLVGTKEAFEAPNQVVLTLTKAKVYFGDVPLHDLIGKEIVYQDSLSANVCGVVDDLKFNTDLDFTDFISYSTMEKTWLKDYFDLDGWGSVNSATQLFVRLSDGTPLESIESQLALLSEQQQNEADSDWGINFKLQPLSDLHFNPEVGIFDHNNAVAHLPTLQILIVVAIVLLVIASINFINLETAHALRRSKEVGVRKVLGSSKAKLISQFMAESLLLTIVSIVLAIPISKLALSYFSDFVPAGVTLNAPALLPFFVVTTVVVALLAGLYPAFVLSSFLPVAALKGNSSAGPGTNSSLLRRGLIVFQFTCAQILIIGTLVVGSQISYLLNKDLGFRKDAVVYFMVPYSEMSSRDALINELKQISEISDMTLSHAPPSYTGLNSSTVAFKTDSGEVNANGFQKYGDTKYIDFYGIHLIAGRNLHRSDTVKEIVINETMVKELGFSTPDNAIGQLVFYNGRNLPIVGVVKNFHIQSLHHKVEAVMIANEEKRFRCINIRFNTAGTDAKSLKPALDKVEAAWTKVLPDHKLDYRFLDDTIESFYQTERRTSKLVNVATGLAILISCLGLLGLASYTTIQRTKEIGIRKVLGASVRNIVLLLTREIVLLIAIAFVIAAPAAWFSAGEWLSEFAFHTDISMLLLAGGGLIAMAVAFATVGFLTFKAANRNPVDSLRTE